VLRTDATSKISFTAVTNGRSDMDHYFEQFSEEGGKQVLPWKALPRRYDDQSVITFYSNQY
jgi:hypothetical protein